MGDDAFNKLTNTPTFTNVQQVIVRDITTSDAKELFLIYDGKVACDIRGKRYKVNGLNTHKAVHKKKNSSKKLHTIFD